MVAERKITTVKLDKKEWQAQIRKTIHEEHQREEKIAQRKAKEAAHKYKKYLPVPIVIGIIACIIMYKEYGIEQLIETILSWTIGITIITTIIGSIKK